MTLEEIDAGLWLAEGGLVSFHGFPFPTRCVVAQLANGDLWIWSPVRLTSELRTHVENLGRVAYLVSPNKLHYLFLAEWKGVFPSAELWGPHSTIKKCPRLEFAGTLEDEPPSAWRPVIDQAWFRGSFFMDEVVFLHRPSRTVIVADLIENFSEPFLQRHWSWWQRILGRLDGVTTATSRAPLEWRLSFVDRSLAKAARDKMLAWPCERVIMAHGEWQRAGGHAFLARSFSWLGKE
jgi:hypothetical protein